MSTQNFKNQILKLAPLWALLGYGSWAAFVNYWAQSEQYIQAGLIQGTYAFISTFILRLAVLKLYQKFSNSDKALIYTYLISFALLISIPSLIHYLFGTQEIILAILPGAIIGGFYLLLILKYEVNAQ